MASSAGALPTSVASLATGTSFPADGSMSTLSVLELVGQLEHARARGLRWQEERAIYSAWLASNPASPGRHLVQFNLGSLLQAQGELQEARQVYSACLLTRPLFAPAAINLGLVFELAGQVDEALGLWQEALTALGSEEAEEKSYQVVLLNHLARLFEELKRYEEALGCLERSLRLDPEQMDPIQHWVHIRQRVCAWPAHEGLEQIPRAMKVLSLSPLPVLAMTDDPAVILMVARETLRRKFSAVSAPRPVYRLRQHHERVRIGYLSGDLCTHAVGVLLPQFFAEHDREQVELYAYDYSIEDGTALRQQLCAAFDVRWDVRALSDAQVAQRIYADGVDVLIDLHGLSFGARPEITRLRPAPLQGTYLGYMGTTGMQWLDFVVADRYVLPPPLEAWFVERPLHVEGCFLPLPAPAFNPYPALRREELGLSAQQILLAAPANTYKLLPEMLAVWFAALRARPEAVLWMIDDNPAASYRLREEARKAGIDPHQLLLRPRVAYARFAAELALADLFLDTFPYNCGSTARDAVLAGVPILTCSGRSMVSRMGGSLVTHTGLGLPIAADLAEYAGTLCAWVRDYVPGSPRLAAQRGVGHTPAASLVSQLIGIVRGKKSA